MNGYIPLNASILSLDTGSDIRHSLQVWSEDKVTGLIPRRQREGEYWKPLTYRHHNYTREGGGGGGGGKRGSTLATV